MKHIHEFQESVFNSTYMFLSKNSSKVHIHVVDLFVHDPYLKSMAKDGLLTLNIAMSACKAVVVKEGLLHIDMTIQGSPRTIIIPLYAIAQYSDGYGKLYVTPLLITHVPDDMDVTPPLVEPTPDRISDGNVTYASFNKK